MLFSFFVLAIALLFGVVWGAGENRCWKEAGEGVILCNFKLYHLLMALLFGTFNAFAVCLIFRLPLESVGFAAFLNARACLTWVWLMLWNILILDVVWWIIRYEDLKHLGQVMFAVKFLRLQWVVEYPAINEYDYGQGKPWHSREDWDNWLHPELWFGTYPWWFVMAGLLVVIGSGIVVL
jgi:hypothetical protein